MRSTILVVEDDNAHRSMLKTLLGSWGFAVQDVADGEDALALVREGSFDAVLSDIRMARMDGIRTLKAILACNPALPVILMTAYSSVENAVEALRVGAADYLLKPLDFNLLRKTLERCIEHSRLGVENRELRRQLAEARGGSGILGHSPAIRQLGQTIATVAPSEATVLITGESGTGKELVARALHRQSKRADKPLVVLNCAALSENLLESELFGHEKGAFTGADKRRDGRFAQADGGTLFLDEIGEMPLAIQAKLLRALQQGEVQRVGSDLPLTIDVRILAATNRDLAGEVAAKRFRQDLYFRLNVITIELPPLRQRREDIPLLASHFLQAFAGRNHKSIRGFAPRALDILRLYSWPGNVRELENAVERAVVLAMGDLVTEQELPPAIVQAAAADSGVAAPQAGLDSGLYPNLAGQDDDTTLETLERRAIAAALQATGNNKSEAARRLGITRATLHNKLQKYQS